MKKYSALTALFLFFLATQVTFADSRSDFDFQYSKYRQYYSEFSLYRKDYFTNPTLDNQQKALITGKQAINTRDLTKASFASYVKDLILIDNQKYEPMMPIVGNLVTAQQFFLSEAAKGQSIVTVSDMETFNTEYQVAYPVHERSIKVGIVAHKVAKLKYLVNAQQTALKSLKDKIPNTVSVRVTERIAVLEANLQIITEKVDNMATYLNTEESMENADSEVFFTSKVEQLAAIRSLQLDWMEQLIDLDINYGKI